MRNSILINFQLQKIFLVGLFTIYSFNNFNTVSADTQFPEGAEPDTGGIETMVQPDSSTDELLMEMDTTNSTVKKLADSTAPQNTSENELAEESGFKVENIPFYRKWWFSILLILPLAWWYFNKFQKREAQLKNGLEKSKTKYKELNALFKEREKAFELKEEEFVQKSNEELELKFQAIGLSKFASLLSSTSKDLAQLGQQLITDLVEYLQANAGVIYLQNSSTNSEITLEVLSSYGADLKVIQSKISPGEGYVGTCFLEGKTMELNSLPESYFKITSGLGAAIPKYILFVPLKQETEILGVIEISCFTKLEPYKIDFIEKLSLNFTSGIIIKISTEKMQGLLEQSRIQTEEMRAQEEELRQNLEEMNATQEELNRQNQQNQAFKQELEKEKTLLDALLTYLPDYLYFKDTDSKFIHVSQSMKKIFNVSDVNKMVGKSDFDFNKKEVAQAYFNEEQKIIKSRKGIINEVRHELFENGAEQWSSITKMPLITQKGDCIGTFGITKDITSIKHLEIEAKNQSIELSRKEELLLKEKALLDAIMNNLPEYIYFKDHESQFIRISKSMLKLFPFDTLDEMVGKSDFDFQPKETAQKYYEEEKEIIRSGKGFVDSIAHEVMENGLEQWVATTKLPFYDDNGQCVGTFGISKDITLLKQNEIAANTLSNELSQKELLFLEREKELKEEVKKLKEKLGQLGK